MLLGSFIGLELCCSRAPAGMKSETKLTLKERDILIMETLGGGGVGEIQ